MMLGNKHTAGFLSATLVLLSLGLANVSEAALQVGDTICVEGFVMDQFCIDRGTLLDAPSIVTLEEPDKHSFHCLIDVNSCATSNFEVLLAPKNGETMYKRGWQLDEASKQRAIALGRSVGSCTTCAPDNNDGNSHKLGFRAAMTATILDLSENAATTPPIIQIINIEDTTAFVPENWESACTFYFGVQDILDKAEEQAQADIDAGGDADAGNFLDNIAVAANARGSGISLKTKKLIHGSLMMVSWGFLLPSGTLIAKFYKHRPDGLWFKLHRAIQTLGLILALAGWIIALVNFNVFKDYGYRNFQHGVLGMVVMILGILQPLNALIRPHAPESEDEAKSTMRVAWEIWHKASGWLAVVLAVPTIVLGTMLLPAPADQNDLQIGYGVGCIGGLLLLVAYIFYDKITYEKNQEETETKPKEEAAASPKKEEVAAA